MAGRLRIAQTAASAAVFCRFLSPRQRPPGDFFSRPLHRRFHRTSDVVRQVSVAAIAFAFRQMPAIFTDQALLEAVIRRDKNARQTRGQMQRKV
ncbi:hypothetical protein FCJ61_30680 [Burkholderia metallica]|uniref:hypothetical protein n=1 Tax=Burkholderia metallica TaxID=488729 RepID=UPI00157B0959|nr:hypothetical protein [Burkholderia metallica]NTZ87235.1 hypothetical protein [Burkholderia metallica]